MMDALRAKFTQNPKARAALLHTGNAILAEATEYDTYFGIGMDINADGVEDPTNWPGKNVHGENLMQLRKELND
jgi:ribA/ribD-fused uncharacterized protein